MTDKEIIPKINPKNPKVIPCPNFSSTFQPKTKGGRPKGSVSIMKRVKEILARNGGVEELACGKAILKTFKKGNAAAIKEILGRIDGPLVEKHQIDAPDLEEVLAGLQAKRQAKK